MLSLMQIDYIYAADNMSTTQHFWYWNQNILAELHKYHVCWCPVHVRSQDISSHSIDYAG